MSSGMRGDVSRWALGWAMGAALVGATLSAQATMTIPGSFEVDQSGNATYSIPIVVPPGTAGLAPKLSLDYSSGDGTGLVGIGWSLSGLPVIARCARTVSQDGAHGAITFDAGASTITDRFCLDGQRLVKISSGAEYWNTDAEYRLESDSFSKIVASGSLGNGPQSFTVWTKSGQVIEFGGTVDSRVRAIDGSESGTSQTNNVRFWAVNKISDTQGNYMTVTYESDVPNFEYRPLRIDYTGNAGSTPVLTPYASVQFSYQSRTDRPRAYLRGYEVQTIRRLTNIKTYVLPSSSATTQTLVADYRLAYDYDGASGRSRLKSVTLCGKDNSCLPATSITYQDGGTGFNSGLETSPTTMLAPVCQFAGDFNGDGKADIARFSLSFPYQVAVALSQGVTVSGSTESYTFNHQVWSAGYFNCVRSWVGDFNGDGKSDLVYVHDSSGAITYYISSGTSFIEKTAGNIGGPAGAFYFFPGDFNGDGLTDFAAYNISNSIMTVWLTSFNPSTGIYGLSSYMVYSAGSMPFSNVNNIRFGDFDGDGITDFVVIGYDTLRPYYGKPGSGSYSFTPAPFVTELPTWPFNYAFHYVGDFNGDGRADIMSLARETTTNEKGRKFVKVNLSRGGDNCTSTKCESFHAGAWLAEYVDTSNPDAIWLGDFNGDGKTDFANRKTTVNGVIDPTKLTVHLAGTAQEGFINTDWGVVMNADVLLNWPMDFDGDGKTDMLGRGSANPVAIQVNHTKGPYPDLATKFATGIGHEASVVYKPLTDSSVYTKDTTSLYPVTDVQSPYYVVSQVKTKNGIGGTANTNYSYVGLKHDLAGRGSLGYRQVKIVDAQTLVEQLTTYAQDYPYTGMILSKTKKISSTILNSADNTYTPLTDARKSATSLGSQAYYRYVVNLLQSVAASKELDGSSLPTITTTYTYDSYANPKTIVTASDGYTKTTTNKYDQGSANISKWFLDRLTETTVKSVTP